MTLTADGWHKLADERAAEITRLRDVVLKLQDENNQLRAVIGHNDKPCVYCALPADEQAKCRSGFPGCARADDQMGCPNAFAAIEANELRELLDKAERYRFSPRVVVERRDGDEWVIICDGLIYSRASEFDFVKLPADSDEDFSARVRFTLQEAFEIADQLVATRRASR